MKILVFGSFNIRENDVLALRALRKARNIINKEKPRIAVFLGSFFYDDKPDDALKQKIKKIIAKIHTTIRTFVITQEDPELFTFIPMLEIYDTPIEISFKTQAEKLIIQPHSTSLEIKTHSDTFEFFGEGSCDHGQIGLDSWRVGMLYDLDYQAHQEQRGFMKYEHGNIEFCGVNLPRKIYIDLIQDPNKITDMPVKQLQRGWLKNYYLFQCPFALIDHPYITLLHKHKRAKINVVDKKNNSGVETNECTINTQIMELIGLDATYPYTKLSVKELVRRGKRALRQEIKKYKRLRGYEEENIKECEMIIDEAQLTDEAEFCELEELIGAELSDADTYDEIERVRSLKQYLARQKMSDAAREKEYERVRIKKAMHENEKNRCELEILKNAEKLRKIKTAMVTHSSLGN